MEPFDSITVLSRALLSLFLHVLHGDKADRSGAKDLASYDGTLLPPLSGHSKLHALASYMLVDDRLEAVRKFVGAHLGGEQDAALFLDRCVAVVERACSKVGEEPLVAPGEGGGA
jgi:hypothetical protein